MGKVGLLPRVSHTGVKAHVCKQDPTYAGPSPCTQDLKNIPAYTRIELRTHESKLCMQTQPTHEKSTSSAFSRIHHPKSILNMFLPFLIRGRARGVEGGQLPPLARSTYFFGLGMHFHHHLSRNNCIVNYCFNY